MRDQSSDEEFSSGNGNARALQLSFFKIWSEPFNDQRFCMHEMTSAKKPLQSTRKAAEVPVGGVIHMRVRGLLVAIVRINWGGGEFS